MSIAGQTAGPIGLKFCVDTYGWPGGVIDQKIDFFLHFFHGHLVFNISHSEFCSNNQTLKYQKIAPEPYLGGGIRILDFVASNL